MIRIGMLLYPQFQLFNLSVATVFEFANDFLRQKLYDLTLLSEHGGAVRASCGVVIETVPYESRSFDTIFAFGDNNATDGTPGLREFLRRSYKTTRRIGGPCTGAFNLAGAGLLDGRRATTHWFHALKMRRDYPAVNLQEDKIFVQDDRVWTSAGATACIDLALAFVEGDSNSDVAKHVARMLVIYHRRAGGQSQHSAMLEIGPRSDRIQKALAYAKRHLSEDLYVDKLAEVVHMSTRQFSRAFADETGTTPAKAIERLRIEAARLMLESRTLTLETVAREAGFGDSDRMRRAFIRLYGESPQSIRRRILCQNATSHPPGV